MLTDVRLPESVGRRVRNPDLDAVEGNTVRLKPRFYVHVLDRNTGVARVEAGPQVLILKDHEEPVGSVEEMVVVPRGHYCIVRNPVLKKGDVVDTDRNGQVLLRSGDLEIRFEQPPFPLYPGEAMEEDVRPLTLVAANAALRLRAIRDFSDGQGEKAVSRKPGDEWLFLGSGTYTPHVEVEVVEVRQAKVITDKNALHLRSLRTHKDAFGQTRKAGDEWLVTVDQAEAYIPHVDEEVLGNVPVTILNDRQYCIVLDPLDEKGKPQLGKREVRKGRTSFFLHPGESLQKGVQNVYVLGEGESLLLRAIDAFTEAEKPVKAGDRWMIDGPAEYVPRIEVEVVETRKAIALDKNEGRYVRNIRTGEIVLVRGPQAYMLKPYEELWQKPLPAVVEELLTRDLDPLADRSGYAAERRPEGRPIASEHRDRSWAVTFQVPQNAACQVYDYKAGTARVVMGPGLVMLQPDEQFTVLNLSGGKPKQPNVIKSLALLLGPDFMTDEFQVETADHCLLKLRLSYNWQFEVKKGEESHLFQIPDFVGDACKAIASRVRGAVAGKKFDDFHKGSARIIRESVFGADDGGHIRDRFFFTSNGLVVTNVDIQSVEPVDETTRTSLRASVQQAIKITTDAEQAAAQHRAAQIEAEARARLELQGVTDSVAATQARKELAVAEAERRAVEETGQKVATAKAEREAAEIDGEARIKKAETDAEAADIEHEAKLARDKALHSADVAHQKALKKLELDHARALASIEAGKFADLMKALGKDTLTAIAKAPLDARVEMLKALGVSTMLLTDGKTPLNLIGTADGLIGLSSNGGTARPAASEAAATAGRS